MMISTTSRYSPPGPPVIRGNIGVLHTKSVHVVDAQTTSQKRSGDRVQKLRPCNNKPTESNSNGNMQ
ncbi:hypothetical protein HanRHA438_Chr09g0384921 [Helianthus annuus]|nr:hypothetical protein HanRHA438_Chr09g0384921 [Helianthus annuus]